MDMERNYVTVTLCRDADAREKKLTLRVELGRLRHCAVNGRTERSSFAVNHALEPHSRHMM